MSIGPDFAAQARPVGPKLEVGPGHSRAGPGRAVGPGCPCSGLILKKFKYPLCSKLSDTALVKFDLYLDVSQSVGLHILEKRFVN
jgi:hypothetical protein